MNIHTARLCLRTVRPKDIPALVTMLNDWQVAQWLSLPPYPYTVKDGEEFCAVSERNHADERVTLFGVATLSQDELIGSIEIFPHDDSTWGVGYWLGRNHWGRGYAREALAAVIQYASTGLGFSRTFAMVDPENASSCRLLVGLGFQLTRTTPLATPTRRGCTELHTYCQRQAGMPP